MIVQLAETPRLKILRLDAESVVAALENRLRLEELVGAQVDPEWPLKDMRDLLSFVRNQFGAQAGTSQWGGVIVRKSPEILIGDIGFHASPVDGQVEIGYSVVPSHRGMGFASEAVAAFVDWGFQHPSIGQILARVETGNDPSRRVLEKTGFMTQGETDGFARYFLPRPGV
jgi:RimJ/RimL family protein N-acetyltransferase